MTSTVFSSLPRMNVTETVWPTSCERTSRIMPSAEVMALPLTAVMMSPFWMPAFSAGPPEATSAT